MKHLRPKLISGLNFLFGLYSIMLIYLLYLFIRFKFAPNIDPLIIKVATIFLLYFLLCFWVNRLEIYSDRVVIVYCLRFFYRNHTINNSNITLIRYLNYSHAYQIPTIQVLKRDYKTKLDLPFNSFPVLSFEKRKKILKHFHSIGVPVVILSEQKRDLIILE